MKSYLSGLEENHKGNDHLETLTVYLRSLNYAKVQLQDDRHQYDKPEKYGQNPNMKNTSAAVTLTRTV